MPEPVTRERRPLTPDRDDIDPWLITLGLFLGLGTVVGLMLILQPMLLLTAAYALVPVVSAVGWAPQVIRLVQSPQSAAGMSVATWGIWSATGLVGLLYSLIVVQNGLISAFYAVNTAGQLFVLGFALSAARARA